MTRKLVTLSCTACAIVLAAAVPQAFPLIVPSLTMVGQIDGVVNVPAIRHAYAAARMPGLEASALVLVQPLSARFTGYVA